MVNVKDNDHASKKKVNKNLNPTPDPINSNHVPTSSNQHVKCNVDSTNAAFQDHTNDVNINKRPKIFSQFVTTSQPIQGILSGLLRRLDDTTSAANISLQSTHTHRHTSPTIHYDEQPSVVPQTSDNLAKQNVNKKFFPTSHQLQFSHVPTSSNHNVNDTVESTNNNVNNLFSSEP